MCLGFCNFSGFLHHVILVKLATTSKRVKVDYRQWNLRMWLILDMHIIDDMHGYNSVSSLK